MVGPVPGESNSVNLGLHTFLLILFSKNKEKTKSSPRE